MLQFYKLYLLLCKTGDFKFAFSRDKFLQPSDHARTVARKSSIGGLDVLRIEKKTPPIYRVPHLNLGVAWSFGWGLSPPKPPVETGLGHVRFCINQ